MILRSSLTTDVKSAGLLVKEYFQEADKILTRLNADRNLTSEGRATQLKAFTELFSERITKKLESLKNNFTEFEKETEKKKEKEALAWQPLTQMDELVFYGRQNDYAKKLALFRTAADFFNEYEKRLNLESWENVRMFESEAVGLLANIDQLKSIELQEAIRRTQEKRISQVTKDDIQFLKDMQSFRNSLDRLLTEGQAAGFRFYQTSTLYALLTFSGLNEDVPTIANVNKIKNGMKRMAAA